MRAIGRFAVALYIVLASLTGGYVYNHRDNEGNHAIFCGIGWPLYWIGRAGLEVAK